MDPFFEKTFISTKEAGDLCGYGPDYLSRLIRQGKVQGHRIGHSWFVEPASLQHFIREQNIKKVEHAKQLSARREQEYRAHQSPIKKAATFFQTPLSVRPGSRVFTECTALGVASLVLAGGFYGAHSSHLPAAFRQITDIAAAAAYGFAANIEGLRDAGVQSKSATRTSFDVYNESALTQRDIAAAVMPPPTLEFPHTASDQISVGETHSRSVARAVSVEASHISREDVRRAVQHVVALALEPSTILTLLAHGYVAMGEAVYDTIVSIQDSYVSGISAAGENALALGVEGRDAVANVPRTILNIGDVLVEGTVRIPDVAYSASLGISALPLEYAPKIARAVFGAEVEAVQTVLALGNGLASGSLAFVQGTGNLALGITDSLDRASASLARTLFEIRSSNPSALAAVLGSDAGLSFTQWIALSTYETIHDAVDSTSDALAVLFVSTSKPLTSTTTPQTTSSPSVPVASDVTNAPTSSPVASSAPSIFNTYITGVSQEYVAASLQTLRTDLANQMVALIAPVAQQTITNVTTIQQVARIESLGNLTVSQGNFTNSVFDGGTIKNVNSIGGTSGSFTTLTTNGLTATGDISTTGFSSASYFTATSTTATSTFAGAFAVGTTSPFGDSFFTVGSSTPLFHITRTNGFVGIGTSSPYAQLSVVGQVAAEYFTATSTTATSTFNGGLLAARAPTLAHTFSSWSIGAANTNYANASFVVDPSSATADSNLFALAVNGSAKFLVDAEGDVFGNSLTTTGTVTLSTTTASTFSVENNTTLGDSITDITTINGTLVVAGTTTSSTLEGKFGVGTTSPWGRLSVAGLSGGTDPLFTISSSTAGFATSTAFHITSSGLVGIGTTSPSATLAVAGTGFFDSILTALGIITAPSFVANSSSATSTFAGGLAVETNGFVYDWQTNSVGIGTAAPVSDLHINDQTDGISILKLSNVNSGALTSDGLNIATIDANAQLWLYENGYLRFATNNSERLRIDSSGNVGIGTTSPETTLAVQTSAGEPARFVSTLAANDNSILVRTNQTNSSAGIFFDNTSSLNIGGGIRLNTNGSIDITTGQTAGLGNYTANTRLSVTSAGYVGVGSTSPWGLLSVNPTSAIGSIPAFVVGSSTATRFIIDNGGLVGIGTSSPSTRLSVQDTVSTAQLRVAYDTSRYADLQVDSTGNLILTPQSNQIYTNDGNFFACASGACPSGTISGTGNIIAETRIGIGTSTPSSQLDIVASTPTISIRDSSLTSGFTISQSSDATTTINNVANGAIVFGTNNTERVRITNAGRVGIGTTSPSQQFSVADRLFVGANGATGLGTATSTFQGDLKITGKLDVGTIDPVYTIDGVKYATYGHSTVGIKEEAVATVNLDSYNPSTRTYQHVINFSELPKGSDLWLFYQITDFGSDWEYLIVSLTPGFEGAVSYRKLPGARALVVESTRPGEVTARLLANRFNWKEWPTLRPDQDTPNDTGFVLSSKK